ncbi:hypothetical protein [Gemmatimonas phototrophica]|uniref:Uncharacterized protein n=1 Tax=Gemmatimonas phototrophica TaxID=1379270 RepID=A0A143BJR9_9BACT|nr:hypothetical protein [Gemmatimonas phototrophica]AMW04835.1 hypothetical protein GEMMAAP_08305 [Gemmatimonas phototrophica]
MLHALAAPVWLVLVLGAFAPRTASAQAACNGGTSCSVTVTLRLGRPEVFRLSLSQATTVVPALTAADFAAGLKDAPGPVLTVLANAPYRVTVQAAAATWQYTGASSNPAKSSADLRWARTAGGPWTSSSSATTIWPASGTAAPATAGQTISLFYRTLWQWTGSPPGAYTLPVNLTLTSP